MKFLSTRPYPAKSNATAASTPNTAGAAVATFFKHPSTWILSALIIGCVAWRAQLGPFQAVEALAALIIWAFWPLLEWGIHVYLLHQKPRKLMGRELDFLLPQTHRWHHADPWNLKRVFIPLHIYPLVLSAVALLLWWLQPPAALTATILACYFLLALHYEWVHYLGHINWCPPLKYYQTRVREHRLHHFRNEKRWWGVSRGLGDRILGTAPDPAAAKPSSHTHYILGNE